MNTTLKTIQEKKDRLKAELAMHPEKHLAIRLQVMALNNAKDIILRKQRYDK